MVMERPASPARAMAALQIDGLYPWPAQKEGSGSKNVSLLRLPRNWARTRSTEVLPWNGRQACGSPPELNWWRKDLRSIPKVFLIDAYEVS